MTEPAIKLVKDEPVPPAKPTLEDSGYDCRNCGRDIAVGRGWNFPVERREELTGSTLCGKCRGELRRLSTDAGRPEPKIFPLPVTLKWLEELEEKQRRRAEARLKEVFNSLGRRPTPPPDRKREKRERDRQLRERMKGHNPSPPKGHHGKK